MEELLLTGNECIEALKHSDLAPISEGILKEAPREWVTVLLVAQFAKVARLLREGKGPWEPFKLADWLEGKV